MYENLGIAGRQPAGSSPQIEHQFLGMMSHELRTPIQAVLGYTALLLAGCHGPLTEEQRKDLRDIQVGAERIMSVFEQMLDLAHIYAHQLTPRSERVDVEQLLVHAHKAFAPRAEAKGLALNLDLPGALTAVRGDPARIHQIVHILIDNAIKFTATGHVHLAARSHEGQVVIAVRDTGIGITPEVRARMFVPFQQGDRSTTRPFGGAGLGLALAHELARLMGGCLDVESSPGEGATFTLQLPGYRRTSWAAHALQDTTCP